MFPQRNNRKNPEQNQGDSPPPRWLPSGRLLIILMVILMIINIFTFRPEPPTANLSYTQFLKQVRNDHVATLKVEGQQAVGTFEEPIAPQEDMEVTGGIPLAPGPAKLARFTVTLPSIRDERLLPLLEEHDVEVTSVARETPLLLGLLFTFGPTLLLIGLIIYFIRRQMNERQGMFNFGRSRAKEHTLSPPGVRFGDVAGADESKMELMEVVDFLKDPDRFKQLGARIPRGVLLVGPPGTGKTLLARAVAGEAGVPFFSTSASEFVEMFVGIGASRVRDLFNQARRNSPAIIFIDELDAIGRQRGAGMGGGHDEREQTLNQILVEMDGFEESVNVIVVAATNRADVLDPALMRPGRFDRQITVDLPDVRGREAILRIHLKGKPAASDVDASVLARQTPGFAGANLANLVNEAALHAARKGEKLIHMVHFREALDKIVLGTERPLLMTERDRTVIAYHEAGHALVALMLPESDPVNKVTIIPRGRSLGVTEYLPEGDRFNYSRQYLLTMIAGLLGGRAAEHVAIGEITTGAENDLQRATQLARNMVGRWGMSEELGLMFASDGNQNPFLGREMGMHGAREHSEATAAILDQTIRHLLEERMATAVGILTEQRDALDRLAQALLKYETLDKHCIQAAIRGEEVPPPELPCFPPSSDGATGSQDQEKEPPIKPRPETIPA
jgi:cell division protease FtsH